MGAEDRGWGSPASNKNEIVDMNVVGVSFPGGIHRVVKSVMESLALEFHRKVESLHDGWCWGYSYRKIDGSDSWSNHAWGLAIDVNAPDHPMGVRNTFNRAQRKECRNIAKKYGCRWGGDYSGRPDDMHFEFIGSPADARSIGGSASSWGKPYKGKLGTRTISLWDRGQDVKAVQRILSIKVDGYFGEGTESAVEQFQRDNGLEVDGVVGPKTREALQVDELMREIMAWFNSKSEFGKFIHDQVWWGYEGDDIPNLPNRRDGDGENPEQFPAWALARAHWDSYNSSPHKIWTHDHFPVRPDDEDNPNWQARSVLSNLFKDVESIHDLVQSLATGLDVNVDTAKIADSVVSAMDSETLAASIRKNLSGDLVSDLVARLQDSGDDSTTKEASDDSA